MVTQVLASIMLCHLKPNREGSVSEYQAGFRPDRSGISHVFILPQLLKRRTHRLSTIFDFSRFENRFIHSRPDSAIQCSPPGRCTRNVREPVAGIVIVYFR